MDPNQVAVPINSIGECANIIIKKGDGRVFDLGKPKTLKFKINLVIYKVLMWLESKGVKNG